MDGGVAAAYWYGHSPLNERPEFHCVSHRALLIYQLRKVEDYMRERLARAFCALKSDSVDERKTRKSSPLLRTISAGRTVDVPPPLANFGVMKQFDISVAT